MAEDRPEIVPFLEAIHPYDTLSRDELAALAETFALVDVAEGERIYTLGERLEGLYVVHHGSVEIVDEAGAVLSSLADKNTFGERGLMRDGFAATSARALADTSLLVLPAGRFQALIDAYPAFRKFFARSHRDDARPSGASLAETRVDALMAASPIGCAPDATVGEAARMMRDNRISALIVRSEDDGALVGVITMRDITNRVVAEGVPSDAPVSTVMTPDPLTLPPNAIGSDVLHMMMERGIGHIPIAKGGATVGIVTQTDLTRFQADNAANLVGAAADAASVADLPRITARIPQLLAQLVGAGHRHEIVTRLVTDVADAVTRRLLTMAERDLGPPPHPYLWLACGSQGRREQTGVSDQDNCMILHDDVADGDLPYYEALARFVSDGLDECGYVYCPGDMMATNPRWRQRLSVWRRYFEGWIAKPDTEAQMLASVMFDLRPIGGASALFEGLQARTLRLAARNSIFVAHMVSNSLKHTPPIGLLRGFATLRSGAHKNRIDMKHNGVVPIVDLGRIYALRGELEPVNTHARIEAARAAGVVSESGGRDLLDAYDLIAHTRLEHQARQIRAGDPPDNFMRPTELSDFERSHLRDAFVVVRTMQSAATQGRGIL